MIRTAFGFAALVIGVTLTGCASSQTESEFGNSVRDTMADQRMQPQPSDGTTPSGDGQRIEKVLEVYRTTVGDPSPISKTQAAGEE